MTSFDLVAGERAVTEISRRRAEPGWMTDTRLTAMRRAVALFAVATPHRYRHGLDAAVAQALDAAAMHAETEERSSDDGVVFCDLNLAVRDHPDVVRQHFGTVVGNETNPFATLNAAVWTGGWFVHVPPGVCADSPLQIEVGEGDDAPAGLSGR